MWSRSVSLDPIGSAGCYEGYLLLTVPLPWPGDISDLPGIARLVALGRARGIRVQAICSAERAGAAMLYRRTPTGTGFTRYERTEVRVERNDSSIEAAEALLSGEVKVQVLTSDEAPRDVLVCTHGRRDRCCGSMGTSLFMDLQARTDQSCWSGIRLWRTSHTGGHRFAPTVLILPEGTLWAFMDAPSVEAVLARDGNTRSLAPCYRGCTGLATPEAQVLERVALMDSGWQVFDSCRSSIVEGDGSHVLECSWANGDTAQWRGHIQSHQVGPLPPCGGKVADGNTWTTSWSVAVPSS